MNNKGYLLVEIIVASVLAMTITFFLVELTINLKNINDDYYVNTMLETDQILMLEDVMDDLSSYELVKVEVGLNTVDFTFNILGSEVIKRITVDDNTFSYGSFINNSYGNDVYVNTFDESLDIGSITIENLCYQDSSYVECSDVSNSTKGLLNIKIPAYTLYSDIDYGINLSIAYSYQNLDIVVNDVNYLYYSTVLEDGSDVVVKINRCLDDFSNCSEIATGYSMVNNSLASISPNFIAKSDNLFYTSSRYGTNSYTSSMNLYRCDIDGCSNDLVSNVNSYIDSLNKVSVNSSFAINSDYLYYTSLKNPNSGTYTSVFDLYKCDIDGSNCNAFTTLDVFSKLESSTDSGVGISSSISSNDEYIYYTTYSDLIDDNKVNVDLYKCNIDGSNCSKFATALAYVNSSATNFYVTIVSDFNNVYYSSFANTTNVMDIYSCNKDGSDCNIIKSASGYTLDNSAISINPMFLVNDNYLYYTSSVLDGSGYTNNFVLYRCNKDGSGCISKSDLSAYVSSGHGISPIIALNNDNLYYLTYKSNNSFSLFKCDLDLANCSELDTLEFYSNSDGSIVSPYIYLTK